MDTKKEYHADQIIKKEIGCFLANFKQAGNGDIVGINGKMLDRQ